MSTIKNIYDDMNIYDIASIIQLAISEDFIYLHGGKVSIESVCVGEINLELRDLPPASLKQVLYFIDEASENEMYIMSKHFESKKDKPTLTDVYNFIETATVDEKVSIINTIQFSHKCSMVFDEENKTMKQVKSICQNGDSIQINT